MASDLGMSNAMRFKTLFVMLAICALTLGVVARTAGLLKSNAIAAESKAIDSEMGSLRDKLRLNQQRDAVLDDVTWGRIQNDLPSLNPELLSRTQFIRHQFDPAARVRLLPGLDCQPGTADVDDNANGMIDDPGELGATFSDDQCIVEASRSAPSKIVPSIVLQRGAYVAADQIFRQQVFHPDRILILHQGVDRSWSFVFDW